jgi:hypothetical protein
MMKGIFFIFFFISLQALSAEKIIIEYKKYQRVDLGELEIKGDLVSPGDLSVKERERKQNELYFFERADFDDLIDSDFNSIR